MHVRQFDSLSVGIVFKVDILCENSLSIDLVRRVKIVIPIFKSYLVIKDLSGIFFFLS